MIDSGAFRGSTRIEKVEITGQTIESIGDYAFYNCPNLVSVSLPESVTSIGTKAFQACRSLTSITIPSKVKSIEELTFAYCNSLSDISLPEGLETIGPSAFVSCYSLGAITLPSTVTDIGEFAFSACYDNTEGGTATGLRKIAFGSSLASIGASAFASNTLLSEIIFASENSLSVIGNNAFELCTSITALSLPEGVTDIGDKAFLDCSALSNIILPDTVKHVGEAAFKNTAFYKSAQEKNDAYIYADKWLVGISNDVFSFVAITGNTSSTEASAFLKSDVVGIADRVFYTYDEKNLPNKIEKFYIPASLKYIGNYAFCGAKKLTRISASSATRGLLVAIGNSAFRNCSILSRVSLSNKLETIGEYAFAGCKALAGSESTSFIPDSVTSIGAYAFYNTSMWNNPDDSGLIYAGKWVVGATSNASLLVSIKEGTIGIADYAFYGANSIVTLNASEVKYVGKAAFYQCEKLAGVTFNNDIDIIDDYAFYKCSALQSVTFPSRLKKIGRSAFYKCTSLINVSITDTEIETISDFAFYGCISLSELELNEGLKTIGEKAFYNATALEQITIPSTVSSVGQRAFCNNTALKRIEFATDKDGNSSLEKIADYTFANCKAVETVIIPASIKTIGTRAFSGCESLRNLSLAEGVENIENYAFFRMNAASELVLPRSLKSIGKFAFSYLVLQEVKDDNKSDDKNTEDSSTEDSSEQSSSEESSSSSSNTEEEKPVTTSDITQVLIYKDISTIGAHSFYGYGKATFYTDATEKPNGWDKYWNSSYRPVIWGCSLSEDGSYVVSFVRTATSISNPNALNGISAPVRKGYTFLGWSSAYGSLTADYTAQEVANAPNGTTLYTVWQLN
ncbi:MAG TPA: hypothetical protein DDY77_03640 [Clostridiales bacterium]|nr:hypothetical protein [Clostridiales bacterium]